MYERGVVMRKKKHKRKFNLISFGFLILVIYMSITIMGQGKILNSIKDAKQIKIDEKMAIENELQSLNNDLQKINDPDQLLEIVERIARDEYKMVKPYETVYIDKNKVQNKFIGGIGSE